MMRPSMNVRKEERRKRKKKKNSSSRFTPRVRARRYVSWYSRSDEKIQRRKWTSNKKSAVLSMWLREGFLFFHSLSILPFSLSLVLCCPLPLLSFSLKRKHSPTKEESLTFSPWRELYGRANRGEDMREEKKEAGEEWKQNKKLTERRGQQLLGVFGARQRSHRFPLLHRRNLLSKMKKRRSKRRKNDYLSLYLQNRNENNGKKRKRERKKGQKQTETQVTKMARASA